MIWRLGLSGISRLRILCSPPSSPGHTVGLSPGAAEVPGVTMVVGDGTKGFPERAPFDATVVSAAAPEVPQPLVEQLTEGGGLVHPLGPGGHETVIAYRKRGGRLVEEARLTLASFVPLVGEYGLPEQRSQR